jgi:predicted NBD/HSP70 family sugar kinase
MQSPTKFPFDQGFNVTRSTNSNVASRRTRMQNPPRVTVVIDVGGTTTRAARFTHDHIDKTVQCPTPTVLTSPQMPVHDLQQRLVQVLTDVIHTVTGDLPLSFAGTPMPVAISFSGRVDRAGRTVLAAPDIWGTWATVFDLAGELEQRFDSRIGVRICSDVVAAAWRYEQQSLQTHAFALLMARTGVNYAVCDPHAVGQSDPVLLGHLPVASMPESFRCSCGAMDHVSAFATGAGAANVVLHAALSDPKSFRASAMFRMAAQRHESQRFEQRLAGLRRHVVRYNVSRLIDEDVWRNMNDPSAELTPAELQRWMFPALLDTDMFIQAVKHGDEYAVSLLDRILRPIADHLRDYVFDRVDVVAVAGGFARALGEHYRRRIDPASSSTQVVWAEADDLADLRGAKDVLQSAFATAPSRIANAETQAEAPDGLDGDISDAQGQQLLAQS